MDNVRFKRFESLFKQFVDGTRWLNDQMTRGVNVVNDKQDFNRLVVEPMDAMWAGFTDQEKAYWSTVGDAVRIFKGRII